MAYALTGVATEFGKIFLNNGDLWMLRSGCFDSSIANADIQFQQNHKGKSFGSTRDRLEIYSGQKSLLFRFSFPASEEFKSLSDVAGDMENFFPVSIGFTATHIDTVRLEGAEVKVVVAADLREISICDQRPAVESSYARVISLDGCQTLEEESKSGMFELIGGAIALQRKAKALDNDGKIEWASRTSDYERKARVFKQTLQRLMDAE
jgi:hypothetical protein